MAVNNRILSIAHGVMRANNRRNFLLGLPDRATVFDIGCGNDSAYLFKSLRPDIKYVGLDVGDYRNRHDPKSHADEYIAVPPRDFLGEIQKRAGQFDAVVSSHNLEHCKDQDKVVSAMANCLRPGGRIYLAFPAHATLGLPSRLGTLNFFDDPTHVEPPDYEMVLSTLENTGVSVEFAAERFRPRNWVTLGLLMEPLSRLRGKTMKGTWALYGFESVIWGVKKQD